MAEKLFGLAVKAVIRDDEGRSLMLRRSSANKHFVGQWEWPGGKCEAGEPIEKALLREVLEETGLEVAITGFAGAVDYEMSVVHVILLCFEARVVRGDLKLSIEHDGFKRVPFSEYGALELVEGVRSFMLDYASRKGAER